MDLKTALKDILPFVTLRAKRTSKDEWAIDRPIEFHECSCGDMVDERIINVLLITCEDTYNVYLERKYASFHDIHRSDEVKAYCSPAKPCPRCYRWYVGSHRLCMPCRKCPWTERFPPMIVKRPWFRSPLE